MGTWCSKPASMTLCRQPLTIVAANHFPKSRETAVMPDSENPVIGHSITRVEGSYDILSDR